MVLKFLRVVGAFLFALHALEATETERMNRAHVAFEVQKSGHHLTLRGRESGRETFRFSTSLRQDTYSSGPFFVKSLDDDLYWQYQSETEFFQILVHSNGDLSLMSSPQTYAGLSHQKTYAFKTPGVLENRADQAFYDVVISAHQIHNYATIQALSFHFYHQYRFNSGVIKAGEIPLARANLLETLQTSTAVPRFQPGRIENYGQQIMKGSYHLEGGLSYVERGESVFDELQMSGGDIQVLDGPMIVKKIMGSVGDVSIENKSSLYVSQWRTTETKRLETKTGGVLYMEDTELSNLQKTISHLQKENIRLEHLNPHEFERYGQLQRGETLKFSPYQIQQYKTRLDDGRCT